MSKLNYFKSLFKKKESDWDCKDFLVKSLQLIRETKSFDLYQDDKDAKDILEQELTDLVE